ncbi:MAG: NUDIX domain-containing protein, partial [Thermoplasmata archaeon]
MIQKVLAYILNSDKDTENLLAYSHKEFPEVPLLVPGGTIKKEEKPIEALKREVFEESGLTDLYEFEKLGEA